MKHLSLKIQPAVRDMGWCLKSIVRSSKNGDHLARKKYYHNSVGPPGLLFWRGLPGVITPGNGSVGPPALLVCHKSYFWLNGQN